MASRPFRVLALHCRKQSPVPALQSRLAILPGTTHIGMLQRADWLLPMITDFLDSDLDPTPPTF